MFRNSLALGASALALSLVAASYAEAQQQLPTIDVGGQRVRTGRSAPNNANAPATGPGALADQGAAQGPGGGAGANGAALFTRGGGSLVAPSIPALRAELKRNVGSVAFVDANTPEQQTTIYLRPARRLEGHARRFRRIALWAGAAHLDARLESHERLPYSRRRTPAGRHSVDLRRRRRRRLFDRSRIIIARSKSIRAATVSPMAPPRWAGPSISSRRPPIRRSLPIISMSRAEASARFAGRPKRHASSAISTYC